MAKPVQSGIEFVAGRPKGQQKLRIESVLFPAASYTPAAAKAWLKRHRFRTGKLEAAGPGSRRLRFRQASPDSFQKGSFVTLRPGRKNPLPRRKRNLFGFGGGGREVVTLDQIRELQKDSARSHCYHGDYKAAQRTARQSPKKFAKSHNLKVEGMIDRAKRRVAHAVGSRIERAGRKLRAQPKRKPGAFDFLRNPAAAAKSEGLTLEQWAKKHRGDRGGTGRQARLTLKLKEVVRRHGRNPSEAELAEAIGLYTDFHGKEPGQVVDMRIAAEVPKVYTKLGDLAAVAFLPEKDELELGRKLAQTDCAKKRKEIVQSYLRQLIFEGDDIALASDPSGRQLYFLGGNQDIRSLLKQLSPDAHKDYVRLGAWYRVEYVGRKKFDSFELIQYYHDFGEVSGVRPTLCFDQINCRLFAVGGKYRVEAPGIID